MSVFIGEKNKRVELAERKDAINPNLLLNSKDFSANWNIANATVTSDSYNGGKIVSVHSSKGGTNSVYQTVPTTTSQMATWSVYAKADNAGDKLHTELWGQSGATDQAITTDWRRYSFTGIYDSKRNTLYFWGVSGNKGDINIALPKLEIGNTATPWCPAYDDYAWTGDITNLQNTVNGKVNVDGDLFLSPGSINSWADVQADGNKNVLRSVRTGATGTDFNTGNYDAGILFGGNDTKALISVGYTGNTARVTGGSNSTVWHEDIAWKSDITNLQNTVNQQSQTIQSLTTRLTNAESEISYIKANYIEGKQFPASQEAQAVAWENANPQGIAFITSN